MSKDRGRRHIVGSGKKRRAETNLAGALRLAPGVRLERRTRQEALVLICPDGNVQLNRGAVAIIRLCDGTRRREEIVAQILERSHGRALARDIGEFLDVACARGWIVEAPHS